ncbi:MAG TPA: ABC transporter permease subunit [Gaiellaceae bacterium]|nr:ABC transporter permease subunit [Gaiellaceae bacterium]
MSAAEIAAARVARLRISGKLIRSGLAAVGLAVVVGATFTFIALPLIAIFTHASPRALLGQLASPLVDDALVVSAKTSGVAQLVILAFGTPTAYLLATRRFPGRNLAVTLIELPIVLPPAAAGLGLLVAFGRYGLLGSSLHGLGITIAFNETAVVLAVMLVAGPFYIRQAIAAFEAVDYTLVDASRTLGAGPARTFFRVTAPLAGRGLAAAQAVSLARGLGEFGATIMFAGSLQGRTQTLPLAIYYVFDLPNGLDQGLAISAILVAASVAILLTTKILTRPR